MKTRSSLLIWIGALSGLVGFAVFNAPALNGLLPINRALLAFVCSLMVSWLIVSVIQRWGDRP